MRRGKCRAACARWWQRRPSPTPRRPGGRCCGCGGSTVFHGASWRRSWAWTCPCCGAGRTAAAGPAPRRGGRCNWWIGLFSGPVISRRSRCSVCWPRYGLTWRSARQGSGKLPSGFRKAEELTRTGAGKRKADRAAVGLEAARFGGPSNRSGQAGGDSSR
jgi:hypothetical protein